MLCVSTLHMCALNIGGMYALKVRTDCAEQQRQQQHHFHACAPPHLLAAAIYGVEMSFQHQQTFK